MKRFYIYICIIHALALLASCNKDNINTGNNPNITDIDELGVKFENMNRPLPLSRPGDEVEVQVRGLWKHKDNLKVFINDSPTKVLNLTDSTLSIEVPEQVSSGGIKLLIDDKIVFGPKLPIEGNVTVDPEFLTELDSTFRGTITQVIEATNGHLIAVGDFATTRMKAIDRFGRPSDLEMVPGDGPDLMINSIVYNSQSGKYLVAGEFNTFDKKPVGKMTRLKENFSLDVTNVEILNDNPEDPLGSIDTVPAFNATFNGRGITKLIPSITINRVPTFFALGSFSNVDYIDYAQSTKQIRTFKKAIVRQIARVDLNGKLDSSFNLNNVGANGTINGAVALNDGRVIVVGSFTSYNGKSYNRIFQIDAQGKTAAFGPGSANDEIFSITYNSKLDKIVIAGRFTSYAGSTMNGLAVLNNDGSVDKSFVFGNTESKKPLFAQMLNNKKVLVYGEFERYNGVNRSNLLLLEADGRADQKYNTIGSFVGTVNSVIETTSNSGGIPAIILSGLIRSVDGKPVKNMVKLIIND